MSRTILTARAGSAAFVPSMASPAPTLWLPPAGISGNPIDSIANSGSAGGSFTQSGTPRPAVGTINGKNCPDYVRADSESMVTAITLTNFISASAYHGFLVADLDSVVSSAAPPYTREGLIADVGQFWGVFVRDNAGTLELCAYHWDGASNTAQTTITLSGPQLVEWRFDGSQVFIRLGAATEVAGDTAGNVSTLTGVSRIGSDGLATAFVDGRIAEPAVFNANLDTTNRNNMRAYYAAQYGVTV